jgi:O-antigen/teichoic acid export membrane protein
MPTALDPPEQLSRPLLRSAAGIGLVSSLGAVLRFLNGILLTNLLGVGEYGLYTTAFIHVEALGIVVSLGLHTATARFLPGYIATGNLAEARGLLGFGLKYTVIAALIAVAISTLFIAMLLEQGDPLRAPLLLAILVITAPGSLLRLRQGTLQGFSRVIQAQVLEGVVRPLTSCVVLAGVWFVRGTMLDASQAILLSCIALLVALAVGELLVRRCRQSLERRKPVRESKRWLSSAAPLLGVAVLVFINSRIDLFVISYLMTTDAVGIFSVVDRVTQILALAIGAFAIAYAPRVGELHARNELPSLQLQLTSLARTASLIVLPLTLVLLVAGQPILKLFGTSFEEGLPALRILVLGQIVNVACGAVAMVLTMTGHEKTALRGVAAGFVINLVLDLLLIPRFGLSGAAAATAASVVFVNVTLVRQLEKHTGLQASIIGRLRGAQLK